MNVFARRALPLVLTLSVLTAPMFAQDKKPNSADKKIVVPDVNGAKVRPLAAEKRKATVLFFIAHDCPIANSYAPEINRIVTEYTPKEVAFYVVYVEDDLPAATAKKHAREFGYKCPALRDTAHKLVKRVKATMTPQAVVLAPDGKTLYLGRIDDKYIDFGRKRHEASVRDLRLALDAVLEGRAVPNPKTKSIGCYISGVN